MASSNATINTSDLFSVKGMVALITGGGTGIGLMIAQALADAGASKVYIVGRRLNVLEAAAKSINKPDVVVPLMGDVTSQDSLSSLVSEVEKTSGYLNLLVCNSGVSGPQMPQLTPGMSIQEFRKMNLAFSMEEYGKAFNVNVTAVWYTAMSFLELLDLGNKKGNLGWQSQVVVTSSIAGFNRKAPGGWAYAQSKAAATHLTKQLAGALPTWAIRANGLVPGLFPSEMAAPLIKAYGGEIPEGANDVVPLDTSIVPTGRMGDRLDMAGTILYLVSRAGAYCNGNVMVVDGGRLGLFPSTY